MKVFKFSFCSKTFFNNILEIRADPREYPVRFPAERPSAACRSSLCAVSCHSLCSQSFEGTKMSRKICAE